MADLGDARGAAPRWSVPCGEEARGRRGALVAEAGHELAVRSEG